MFCLFGTVELVLLLVSAFQGGGMAEIFQITVGDRPWAGSAEGWRSQPGRSASRSPSCPAWLSGRCGRSTCAASSAPLLRSALLVLLLLGQPCCSATSSQFTTALRFVSGQRGRADAREDRVVPVTCLRRASSPSRRRRHGSRVDRPGLPPSFARRDVQALPPGDRLREGPIGVVVDDYGPPSTAEIDLLFAGFEYVIEASPWR